SNPLVLASSASANKIFRFSARSLRAFSSEANRARSRGGKSSTIVDISSAERLVGSCHRALTCQTISPIEKTTATAAATQALLIEFKMYPFLSETMVSALVPAKLHLLMMDE